MNSRPEISIIIPVYNAEKFFSRCLDSIINQSFPDWEAICVNDGSTDNALKILQQYALKDSRFKIFTQTHQGVSAARNKGLQEAQGKYIMFLDNDDFIHPQCFELVRHAMEKSGADICQFAYQRVSGNQQTDFPRLTPQRRFSVYDNPCQQFLTQKLSKTALIWDKIYKREIAAKHTFKPIMPGEDDLFSFETLCSAQKFAFCRQTLLYYVCNPASITGSIKKEDYYHNRLVLTNYFCAVIRELCRQHPNQTSLNTLLKKYLAEHYIFKEYILKPLRRKKAATDLKTGMQYVSEKLADATISRRNLRLRYRIVLSLLENGHDKLARLAAG